MPFAIIGTGDLLALYRWSCSRYQATCGGDNRLCSVASVWAGVQVRCCCWLGL